MPAVELDRVEFSDEFSEKIHSVRPLTLDDVIRASQEMNSPWWISALFSIRDRVVSWFGIKTRDNYTLESRAASFGLFPILQHNETELIAGDDDRHLNFRVVVNFCETELNVYTLSFRTMVQFNNRFGRIYFLPVRPLHKIIVPAMLRRFAEKFNSANRINDFRS